MAWRFPAASAAAFLVVVAWPVAVAAPVEVAAAAVVAVPVAAASVLVAVVARPLFAALFAAVAVLVAGRRSGVPAVDSVAFAVRRWVWLRGAEQLAADRSARDSLVECESLADDSRLDYSDSHSDYLDLHSRDSPDLNYSERRSADGSGSAGSDFPRPEHLDSH